MTPFRIRARLKALLGLGGDSAAAAPPPPRPRVTLTVVDAEGREQVQQGGAGDSLVYISGGMDRPIGTGCNDASCASCRCEVLEGADKLSAQIPRERATLKANGFSEDLRLGCQTQLLRDGVRVRPAMLVDLG